MCLFFCVSRKKFCATEFFGEKSFAQNFRRDAQVEMGLLVDDGFSSAHNALHKINSVRRKSNRGVSVLQLDNFFSLPGGREHVTKSPRRR
jgi:hypothetical protein